ncbi:hypothetical protein ACGFZB_03250 [Streptomyces cinerochromogenes]|uniref:Uncharacterized protein n=1 Tax=Streptomyces cinerochromogenes TaxID=66422 RepID=A0ABW7AX40_9ACTN
MARWPYHRRVPWRTSTRTSVAWCTPAGAGGAEIAAARTPRGARAAAHLDTLLDGHDRPAVAAHRPSALVGGLRAVVDPGLDDRRAARAPELLGALPREAFGLLRPSGPPPLRAAEFEDVEVA